MKISGLQKLTLLDYPGYTACIIFTQGCNYACSFCHNSPLVAAFNDNLIAEDEIFAFLEKRRNILDGVVVSGGEPTIQKDLKSFLEKIKKMGYKIKLDTNGSNPKLLEEIISDHLIDYIAMDIKSTYASYESIIKVPFNINNSKKSIELVKKINHEFRTTIIKNFHDINKILEICNYLGKDEIIYLQNFEKSDQVPDRTLESFTKEELRNIQKTIKEKYPNVIVRGID